MKIRNGFVSNSSSSSFVVAFPKKPKDIADVWKYMFNGQQGYITYYDNKPISHADVCSLVFSDLNKNQLKPAKLSEVIEVFSNRYYYNVHADFFWNLGKIREPDGGAWSYPIDRYFGSDKDSMAQLKEIFIQNKKESKVIDDKRFKLINSFKSILGPEPKYAYKGGSDYETKKPFSKREIKAYEKYREKLIEMEESSKEYQDVAAESRKLDKHYEEMKKFEYIIAKSDANNFMTDNKGKYIFIVEYHDNEGQTGCTMEHGDIFRNVPHVKICNH